MLWKFPPPPPGGPATEAQPGGKPTMEERLSKPERAVLQRATGVLTGWPGSGRRALCPSRPAQAFNHYRIHRWVKRGRPLIDNAALNLLEDCKALMGVGAP